MLKKLIGQGWAIEWCPRDELLPIVEEIAWKITSYNRIVVKSAKQAMVRGLDLPLNEGLKRKKSWQALCYFAGASISQAKISATVEVIRHIHLM